VPARVGNETACASSSAAEEAVTVSNDFGDLHGTWTLPAGCSPTPAVLIIAGSGPTDRDGNQGTALSTDAYRLVAEALASRGVSTFRYDKAGVGESRNAGPGREDLVRFEKGADDAVLFVRRLRTDERVSRVIVAGHSEGPLLGMLVAQRTPIDGLASIAGRGDRAPTFFAISCGRGSRAWKTRCSPRQRR
jgi:pimeloyl-ACP methyl ester carboxylesterase